MSWLSILLLLLCPLSMMFMMRGHQHGGHSGDNTNAHAKHGIVNADNQSSETVRMDSYKIKQLEGEIEFLKNQNQILQEKVEEYSKNNPSTKHV